MVWSFPFLFTFDFCSYLSWAVGGPNLALGSKSGAVAGADRLPDLCPTVAARLLCGWSDLRGLRKPAWEVLNPGCGSLATDLLFWFFFTPFPFLLFFF